MGDLLEVEGVELSYGSLQVLFGASIRVPEGGRVALVGTNGAGKTSFLHAVAGLASTTCGVVRLAGAEIGGLVPEARAARGVVLVAGGRAMFPTLTVEENILAGAYLFLADRRRVRQRLDTVLDLFPQLRERLHQRGATLSGGEQQMVALGRALVAEPRLLLIDELSLGLAPVVLQAIVPAVKQMTEAGTTLLLVEQALPVALDLADEIHVMEQGRIHRGGRVDDLRDHKDLAARLLSSPVPSP